MEEEAREIDDLSDRETEGVDMDHSATRQAPPDKRRKQPDPQAVLPPEVLSIEDFGTEMRLRFDGRLSWDKALQIVQVLKTKG